jgi:hypothetical protein
MRPSHCGGLIIWETILRANTMDAIVGAVRPATALVLAILLVLIAVAGVIQLVTILSTSG